MDVIDEITFYKLLYARYLKNKYLKFTVLQKFVSEMLKIVKHRFEFSAGECFIVSCSVS